MKTTLEIQLLSDLGGEQKLEYAYTNRNGKIVSGEYVEYFGSTGSLNTTYALIMYSALKKIREQKFDVVEITLKNKFGKVVREK